MTTFQKQKSKQAETAINFQWLFSKTSRFVLLGATSLLGFLYLIQTSALATKGYDITDLQRQVRGLEHDTQSLDWQIAQYQSMGSIQERLKAMDLVAATDVNYVSAGAVVAKR